MTDYTMSNFVEICSTLCAQSQSAPYRGEGIDLALAVYEACRQHMDQSQKDAQASTQRDIIRYQAGNSLDLPRILSPVFELLTRPDLYSTCVAAAFVSSRPAFDALYSFGAQKLGL